MLALESFKCKAGSWCLWSQGKKGAAMLFPCCHVDISKKKRRKKKKKKKPKKKKKDLVLTLTVCKRAFATDASDGGV